MEKQKRFRTTKIQCYTRSYYARDMYFDTYEEALECVKNDKKLHPRSTYIARWIEDTKEKKMIPINKYEL